MKKGFTITCNGCGSKEVQVNNSIDGVYFECPNPECKQEMNRMVIGCDENGLFIYEDEY